ncbi:MAG: hypothetical protein AAF633_03590 [Chloroflexota bacterium]
MKKHLFGFILILIAIFIGGQHYWSAEASGRWVFNTSHAPWIANQVCQDGYEVTVVNVFGDPLIPEDLNNYVNLGSPRQFPHPVDNAWSGGSGVISPEEAFFYPELWPEYYPIIGEPIRISALVTQTEPILYNELEIFVHTTVVVPFSQEMPVGQNVALGNSGINQIESVADCRFFEYANDEGALLELDKISDGSTSFDLDELIYTVEAVPSTGDMLLNGNAPLIQGSQFSPQDLADGLGYVQYAPTNPSEADQSFVYSVRGTKRVSVNANGVEGDNDSAQPTISGDGSYVAFASYAKNLDLDFSLPAQINVHVFRHWLPGTLTTLISQEQVSPNPSGPSLFPDISADGRSVVFASNSGRLIKENIASCFFLDDTNGVSDIYRYESGIVTRLSMLEYDNSSLACDQMTAESNLPAISDPRNVRFGPYGDAAVVFMTEQDLSGTGYNDGNSAVDVLLNNDKETEWIYKSNKLPIAVPDQPSEEEVTPPKQIIFPTPTLPIFIPVPVVTLAPSPTPPIFVPLPSPTPPVLAPIPSATPIPTLAPNTISSPDEGSGFPDISADALSVAFISDASDLVFGNASAVQAYVSEWDGDGWGVSRVSINNEGAPANEDVNFPAISQYGEYIVFDSSATNLTDQNTNGFAQVYVRDQVAGCTTLLSVNGNGDAGTNNSQRASISADGRYVAFESDASNMINGDTNDRVDIFVVDRDADGDGEFYSDPASCIAGEQKIIRASVDSNGNESNQHSYESEISANGQYVVFTSAASNLVEDDTNGATDIFVHYLGFEREIVFSGDVAEETPTPVSTEIGTGTPAPTTSVTPDPSSTPGPGTPTATPVMSVTPSPTTDPDGPGGMPPVAYLPLVFEE